MLYSNEIVFRGHPDKVCDQISDAIVDECLKQDKTSRCAVEAVGGKGKIFITGEVTTKAVFDVPKIVKRVLLDNGYDDDYEIINLAIKTYKKRKVKVFVAKQFSGERRQQWILKKRIKRQLMGSGLLQNW